MEIIFMVLKPFRTYLLKAGIMLLLFYFSRRSSENKPTIIKYAFVFLLFFMLFWGFDYFWPDETQTNHSTIKEMQYLSLPRELQK